MQCVIVCAGKGTRMQPLTNEKPKPLVPVCGKPILQHIVEALPDSISELILVVGYLQEQIRDFCGEEYLGKKVTYVTQQNFAGGTGDALLCARPHIHGRFLFMYADDIHGPAALAEVVRHEFAILSAVSPTPEQFGVLSLNDDGSLAAIIEKPAEPPSNLINIGGCVLDETVFEYPVSISATHGELLVTDMITAFARFHVVDVVQQHTWLPVGRPADIAIAESILCPEE